MDFAQDTYARAAKITAPRLPPIVPRVLRGTMHNFSFRVCDWYAAMVVFSFGFVLCMWPDAFNTYVFYAFLARMGSAQAWGIFAIGLGAIRLSALFVNGTFPEFPYSPHVRFVAAFMTVFMWFQITLGLIVAGEPTTAFAIYPQLLLFDLYNVILAATEAGVVERRKRNGNGGG